MMTEDPFLLLSFVFLKIRIERSAGAFVENASAEALQQVMSKVTDFSHNPTYPTTAADAMQAMMTAKGVY